MSVKRIKSYLDDRLKSLENIRNERELTTAELGDIACCKQTLAFIDSLQEESVNKDFEMALAEMIDKAQKCVVEPLVVAEQWKDELIKIAKCEEPVSEDFEEALAREWQGYNDRGAATVDALEDNTQELAFAKGFYRGAKWQKEQKNIWHTMDETPNYPCDILFLTNVDSMFLYRYMENGRPADMETPYFHNILNGKCWCYCSDVVNE